MVWFFGFVLGVLLSLFSGLFGLGVGFRFAGLVVLCGMILVFTWLRQLGFVDCCDIVTCVDSVLCLLLVTFDFAGLCLYFG